MLLTETQHTVEWPSSRFGLKSADGGPGFSMIFGHLPITFCLAAEWLQYFVSVNSLHVSLQSIA